MRRGWRRVSERHVGWASDARLDAPYGDPEQDRAGDESSSADQAAARHVEDEREEKDAPTVVAAGLRS
jgi:hypothetical protein